MIVELEKLTVKCLLERTFEKYGSQPSVAFAGEQPIVYLQLKQQLQEVATALAVRGIKKGDRVAIMGENCPNWVIAYLAITSMGAVAVPDPDRLPRDRHPPHPAQLRGPGHLHRAEVPPEARGHGRLVAEVHLRPGEPEVRGPA